ncbi:hypothetical protein niasHT_013222 [Heterodera trifolii]|uniref:Protein kinase domain-containing protein n=1 Tax=Heterodera trifolii TaxID=157864 RepID=A0ABD2KXA7_9BILA
MISDELNSDETISDEMIGHRQKGRFAKRSNESDGNDDTWKKWEWADEFGNLFIRAFIKPISKEEDSQIFYGCVMDFPKHNEQFGFPKSVAIKEVFFRGEEYYKAKEMLVHEVEILKMAVQMEAIYVIKLIDYIILPNSLVMVMELGEESLKHRLNRLKIKWKQNENLDVINSDIKSIFIQMVIALRDLHRFAIHLALKSENWLYVNRNGEKMLALIDFQTSALIQTNGTIDNRSEKKRKELRSIICKTFVGRTHLPRTRSFASPEHKGFCESRGKNQLNVQTDIWSLGISLLEILAYTPQIDAIFDFEFFVKEKRKFKILRDAFVEENENKNKEFAEKAKMAIEEYFPNFSVLVKQMLSTDPKNRPTVDELLNEITSLKF